MTKQVELSNLLKAHRRAVYSHLDDASRSTGPSDVKVVASLTEVDKSEKRIFSLFDKLTKENEAFARVIKGKSAIIGELSRQLNERGAAPMPPRSLSELRFEVMPPSFFAKTFDLLAFNEAKARAGQPIDVLVAPGTWHERVFQGMMTGVDGNTYVVHTAFKDGSDYSRLDHVRMRQTRKEITLYANVRNGTAGYIGAMYEDKGTAEKNAKNATSTGTPVATAVPVKITVAV